MLQEFADWLAYSVLGLGAGTQLGAAVNFFIYDSIKVTALLVAVIFLVGVIRTFATRQKIKKLLGEKSEGWGNVLAALLGIPTPFCSCSAVPIFIGFIEAGVPLGVTFSFLIASPLINEVAATMLFAMFGWQIAALYITSGLVIAVVAGVIIGRLGLEGEIEDFVRTPKAKRSAEAEMGWKHRIGFGISQSRAITMTVLPYLLLGIAIGGIIHGYAPSDFLASLAGKGNILAVPIAVLLGIPLYSNAAGMVPIVGVLISKGMATGTALAFMMSVIGLSLPEMVILRKVLKPKLLAAFALVLFVSFVATGYIFNAIVG
ncbi:putative permease [uncultured archaeon]|nr:putative permease [uncultured archaeon]